MYGKSYDAITGLVGTVLQPEGLRAVVAQAPIWDMYRNSRSGGVPRLPLTLAVQKRLVEWLVNHVRREDKALGAFLRRKTAALA